MLFKADIDAAYRRIPIRPGHRQFAAVVFLLAGVPQVAMHFALPFGGVASVHQWDRIGALNCARRVSCDAASMHVRLPTSENCTKNIAHSGLALCR